MSTRRLRDRIQRRGHQIGLEISGDLLGGLELYYRELARWNIKLNLTSFDLDGEGCDRSVDRLLIEPLAGAKLISPTARRHIDIGSGGGSPAIPLKLIRSESSLVMVEAKVRKSAFLRQVVRKLGLADTVIENVRYEELLSRPDLNESFDLLSVRAVRVEATVWNGLQAFLAPGGCLLHFSSVGHAESVHPALVVRSTLPLALTAPTQIVVFEKTGKPRVPRET